MPPGSAAYVEAALVLALESAGASIKKGIDPVALPKACKNATELAGTAAAHRRDGVAVTRFLHWLDTEAQSGDVTEIDAALKGGNPTGQTGGANDASDANDANPTGPVAPEDEDVPCTRENRCDPNSKLNTEDLSQEEREEISANQAEQVRTIFS